MNTTKSRLRVRATVYVPLRPDPGGHLTAANVRRARWGLVPGCSVRVSIYGLTGWEGGAPTLIGRLLAEGGASEVEIQASARPGRLLEFQEAVVKAAREFTAVVR